MRHGTTRPARTWHALSREQKQQRLGELRRRQQAQIELEVRALRHVR